MKGRAIATLAVVLLCGAAREARADESQDHAGRAAILADHEQYRDALAELEAAYALRQSPALLFEMARVHERLGDARRALESYERFLMADVSADTAKRADADAAVSRLRPRYERKPSRGLTAGGAVLFGAGYLAAVVTGSVFLAAGSNGCASYTIGNQPPVYSCPNGNLQIASGLLLIPGAGPFLAAFAYRGDPVLVPRLGARRRRRPGRRPAHDDLRGQAPRLRARLRPGLSARAVRRPRAGGLQAVGRF